jgi:RNA polymerase sigma-70 factor (ECF subfamily)
MSQAPKIQALQEADASVDKGVSFAALYEAHAEAVYAWAMRYARGRTQWAEDVTHDVFVKAWEHRAWLREADVRGWLYRVTQNLVFSALRREQSFGQRLTRLFSAESEADSKTPEAALSRRESVGRAMAALNALPGQERVVLAMKVLDELSQREIAAALGLSEGYVSKLLSRAQARLSSGEWKVDDGPP